MGDDREPVVTATLGMIVSTLIFAQTNDVFPERRIVDTRASVSEQRVKPFEIPEEGLRAVERARGRGKRRRRWILATRVALVLGSLCVWQIVSGRPGSGPWTLIDQFYISKPTAIWEGIVGWWSEGILVDSILITFQETIIGFALGASAGLVVGFLLGINDFAARVLNPILAALYAIPRLALIPLFLLWFGLGIESKIALVFILVFFMVFYNTYSGVRDVDQELIDVLRVMKASSWDVHTKVTIPSAMNWIIAGLRLSVPYALVGAVTGEMIASNRGMGYLIIRSSGQFYTAGVFAGIVVLMCMALVLTGLVSILEKRLLRWKPKVDDAGF